MIFQWAALVCGRSWTQFCWMVVETDGGNAKLQNPCQTSKHRQNPLPVCCFGLCSMETVVPSVDPKPSLSMNSLLCLWLESLTSMTPQWGEHWMSCCKLVSGSSITSVTQEQSGLPPVLGRNQIFLEETCGDAYLSGWGEHKKPDSGISSFHEQCPHGISKGKREHSSFLNGHRLSLLQKGSAYRTVNQDCTTLPGVN